MLKMVCIPGGKGVSAPLATRRSNLPDVPRRWQIRAANHKYRKIRIAVRVLEYLTPSLSIQCDAPMHANGFFFTERLKIGDSKEPDVGGVVPFIMQHAGFRRSPLFGEHLAQGMIGKIRNAHDAGLTDAGHLRQ